MNAKQYVVGAVVAFVAWLVFWPSEELPDSAGSKQKSDSGIDYRAHPREREPLPTEQRYGVAGTPARHPETPYSQSTGLYDYGAPGEPSAYRPAERRPYPSERFTFRPLTEREQMRLERQQAEPSYHAQHRSKTAQQRTMPSEAHPAEPYYSREPRTYPAYPQGHAYADQQIPGYSFRPITPSPSARGKWQGPYQNWQRDGTQELSEPWTTPPNPRWGSTPPDYWTPPAERMYPSLSGPSNRRLTAR